MLDNRGPELQGIFISLLILCVLTVALRCYTMKFIVKRFEIEDWLAVATLVRPRDPVSDKINTTQLTCMSAGLVHRLHHIRPFVRTLRNRPAPQRRAPREPADSIHVAIFRHYTVHRHLDADKVRRGHIPAPPMLPHPVDENHDLGHAGRRRGLQYLLLFRRYLLRTARAILLAPLRPESSPRPCE